jgi:hypothetical protein
MCRRGKSGGYGLIYYAKMANQQIVLITIYSKSDQATLNQIRATLPQPKSKKSSLSLNRIVNRETEVFFSSKEVFIVEY